LSKTIGRLLVHDAGLFRCLSISVLLILFAEAFKLYKDALKDYTNEKTWKFCAAASEMSGLCMYLTDPTKRDLEPYLDNAYSYYQKG
jgi:hypothetical protein